MTAEASELLRRALALPDEERAALANTLLESLDTNEQSVQQAWDEEVGRRCTRHNTISSLALPIYDRLLRNRIGNHHLGGCSRESTTRILDRSGL